MTKKRWTYVFVALAFAACVCLAMVVDIGGPRPHTYPEWRRLIDYAKPIARTLQLSTGSMDPPAGWDWELAVRATEGHWADKTIRAMHAGGIIVDTSSDVRAAGVHFAVVGNRDVVLARRDGWLAYVRKSAFYDTKDKSSIAKEATPFGRW